MDTQNTGARRASWGLPLICSLLLLLGLGFALYKLYALNAPLSATASPAPSSAQAESLTAENARLLEEKRTLQALLEQEPCAVKQGLQEKGQVPATKSPVAPATTESGQSAAAPSTAPASAPAPAAASVTDMLEDATVFVFALGKDSLSMGTGFFITPSLILTNRHVIESSPQKIYIINKKLQKVRAATLVAASNSPQRDYAVLQTQLPAGISIVPLPLGELPRRADKISAWGYPHAISKVDPKFQALIQGKAQTPPELTYSDGAVSAVLERTPPLIVHTALISQGNSGGPLANERGQVVGINTMISLDNESYRQTSLALPSSDIRAFLKEKGIELPAAPQTR